MALVTPLPFFFSFCRPCTPSVNMDCLAFLQEQQQHVCAHSFGAAAAALKVALPCCRMLPLLLHHGMCADTDVPDSASDGRSTA